MLELITAAAFLMQPSVAADPPAPQPPQSADDTVVVTGQRAMTRREARQHVIQTTNLEYGQLGRFFRPVCPAVIGLPLEHASVVESRFREIAARAGIDVRAAPCAPNVNFIVVSDVRQFLEEVSARFQRHGVNSEEITELLDDEGPVRVWTRVQRVNEHLRGMPMNEAAPVRIHSASIITVPYQLAINEVFVVVDSAAAVGKSLTQLADYFAMRALAETRPPRRREESADTILTLFEADAPSPPQASNVDVAYLNGLYRAPPNRRLYQQRRGISAIMARELAEPEMPRRD